MSGSPGGCVELLQRSGVEVAGKEVVVMGRSNIVGMPARASLHPKHIRQSRTGVKAHDRAKFGPREIQYRGLARAGQNKSPK
jgi:methylenetetrahydrofolate dehydrogenase (NADP+)/methenyltetrahydrofolate cyclohydrolase